jgi:hypothetical protein
VNRNKEKGKAFERWVANDLSDIFELSFTRTPNSGAYVGGKNSYRMNTLSNSQILLTEGDIIVPDELQNLKIECKSYKVLPFHQLFTRCKQLDDWIDQASSNEKLWFLLFKINRAGSYICFHDKYRKDLDIEGNVLYYNTHVIATYDGFFERNRCKLLDMCG